LTARAHAIIACDFLVVETVLLKRLHVLVFIEHGTRRLHLAGVTARPTAAWAVQQARNLAMDLDDRLGTMRFKSEGLRIITTLPRTPWMNATCERVIGTLRRELLDRTLILGDRHLDLVLREYVTHYDGHRPHQSRQQRPPDIETQPSSLRGLALAYDFSLLPASLRPEARTVARANAYYPARPGNTPDVRSAGTGSPGCRATAGTHQPRPRSVEGTRRTQRYIPGTFAR